MTDYKNLLECTYYREKNYPDDIYLTQPMGGGESDLKTWTWKETLDEARRMASYLKGLDMPEKSNIAICSKNCAYWIIADLAIWMAGHISVPIFPTLTAGIVQYILEHSETKLLFVGKLDPVWDEMKKGVPSELRKIAFPLSPPGDYEKWGDIIEKNEPIDDPVKRQPEEMATIVYTSGSTGKPKGVMLSFNAMYRSAKGISEYLESDSNDVVLSYLPLAHVFERWVVESHSFYAGFKLFFADSLDTFIHDLQRARPTLFISVPRLWMKFQMGVFQKLPPEKLDRLLKIPILKGIIKKKILTQLGLNNVRFAGSGSAPIPKEVIEWYRGLGLELLEGLGMTENFAYSHCSKPGEVRPGYVGPPYPDVQHRLSDTGEILIKSPGNMMGYYKMPEETKEVFTEDGFVKTGDLGETDEKDRLKITGRAKEIFKTSKGKYVAPAPIENLLSNHPRIEATCVTGSGYSAAYGLVMLSEEGRELLNDGGKPTIEKELTGLFETINSQLPAHEKLGFIAVVKDEWLPENGFLTPTMKIKRSKIENEYSNFAEGWFNEKKPVVWQQ